MKAKALLTTKAATLKVPPRKAKNGSIDDKASDVRKANGRHETDDTDDFASDERERASRQACQRRGRVEARQGADEGPARC